jgi:hypothetical protein
MGAVTYPFSETLVNRTIGLEPDPRLVVVPWISYQYRSPVVLAKHVSGRWSRVTTPPGVFPQRSCTPEHETDHEKRDRSHDSVSDDADVPDLHVREWDTDRARETRYPTHEEENPHPSLRPTPSSAHGDSKEERGRRTSPTR